MSLFDIVLIGCGALISLAALGVVLRMVLGPTILDRAIASDSLVTLVVMAMALYTASAEAPWAGPAMLGLTGLSFIGTVTFARFVAREDPRRTHGPRRHPDEPTTQTGQHDAIHLAPAAGGADPVNPLPGPDGRAAPVDRREEGGR